MHLYLCVGRHLYPKQIGEQLFLYCYAIKLASQIFNIKANNPRPLQYMHVCFVHLACLSTFHREQTSMLVRYVKNESFSSPLWKCCLAFAVNRTDGVTMQASNFQINSAAHRTNCVFCRRNSMTGPEEIRSRRDKHTQRRRFAFLSLLENTQTCGAKKPSNMLHLHPYLPWISSQT